MNEAFRVLERAKQDAEARLRRYESEGDKSKHKLSSVRHAIKELEQGIRALKFMHGEWLTLVRLWNKVEEGNRNVQIPSSTGRRGRSQGNRRRT